MLIYATKKVRERYKINAVNNIPVSAGLFDQWYVNNFTIHNVAEFLCFIHAKSLFVVFHIIIINGTENMSVPESLFYSLGILLKYYEYPRIYLKNLFNISERVFYARATNKFILTSLNIRTNSFIKMFISEISLNQSVNIESTTELMNIKPYKVIGFNQPKTLFLEQINQAAVTQCIYVQ